MSTAVGTPGLALLLNPAPPSPEQMPMVGVILEKMARTFSTVIRNKTGDSAEVELGEMCALSHDEFCGRALDASLFVVGKVESSDTTRILGRFDNQVLLDFVHAMLGGTRANAPDAREKPRLTAITSGFAESFADLMLAELERSFGAIGDFRVTRERIERDPRFAAVAPATAFVISATFHVTLLERRGTFSLALPLIALEPFKAQLSQRFAAETLPQEPGWAAQLAALVDKCLLDLEIEATRVATTVSMIDGLRVGDVFELRDWDGQNAALVANGAVIADAKLLQKNNRFHFIIG